MTKIGTILFDLDGTLADTAPDLALALNRLRAEHRLEPLAFETIRPEVSHGAGALVKLAFNLSASDAQFESLRQRFIELYAEHLCEETRLFDGMQALLNTLAERAIPWGIVTNKPAFLTEPLVEKLGIKNQAACVVSGDSTTNRKPHPEPMLHACALTGSTPERCLYIGDAQRDIEAGHAAGMKTLIALFGYINSHERPETWGADGSVHRPQDILPWLAAHG